MDSLKRRWREWGMFDKGRQPWGHLHSTPLQIAFERGVPTLLVWGAGLFGYGRVLWGVGGGGGVALRLRSDAVAVGAGRTGGRLGRARAGAGGFGRARRLPLRRARA